MKTSFYAIAVTALAVCIGIAYAEKRSPSVESLTPLQLKSFELIKLKRAKIVDEANLKVQVVNAEQMSLEHECGLLPGDSWDDAGKITRAKPAPAVDGGVPAAPAKKK